VLTKPLGIGIVTTAIKRGLASSAIARRAITVMRQLNRAGADLAERRLVKCATDVTGFGLLGHLGNIVRASGAVAEITAADVPMLGREVLDLIERDCIPGGTRSNLAAAADIVDFDEDVPISSRLLLTDAQTSGGLVLCVPPRSLSKVLALLKRHRTPAAAVIGRITRRASPRILVRR
jgi:selenide,water dikinase